MEFFEKLGKKASETYKTAAEKTNKIANETKLKLKINDCKSKIDDIYCEMGKKVYQKYVLDGNLDIKNDLKEEIERVNQLSEEIKNFEKQILELSDKKQCIKCGNKIENTARFCPVCGTEQPVEEAKTVEVIDNPKKEEEEEVSTDTEEILSEIVIEKEENSEINTQNDEEIEDSKFSDNK